jgi:alkylhydroperoxidase family enzyme
VVFTKTGVDAEVAAARRRRRVLREHFEDDEILEQMMMVGQYIGFDRTLAILQLETVACRL